MPIAFAAWLIEPVSAIFASSSTRPGPPNVSPPTVIQTLPCSAIGLSCTSIQHPARSLYTRIYNVIVEMPMKRLAGLLAMITLASQVQVLAQAGEVQVAVAANFTAPMQKIAAQF